MKTGEAPAIIILEKLFILTGFFPVHKKVLRELSIRQAIIHSNRSLKN